jgi:hypothetical protein
MKGVDFGGLASGRSGRNRPALASVPIAAQFGSNLGSQGKSWTVLIDEI